MMAVGTSDGKQYEDNFQFLAEDTGPKEQYAMLDQPAIPGMQGLTAEIDKQAGGFHSGPAGTGRPQAQPKAAPVKTPKITLQEVNMPESGVAEINGQRIYRIGGKRVFAFVDEEGKVHGDVHITPEGKLLHGEYLNIYDPNKDPYARARARAEGSFQSDTSTAIDKFSIGYMPSILQQIKQKFPEAERIEGLRITGSLAAQAKRRKEQGLPYRSKRQGFWLPELEQPTE